jgi:hypothetical protein
MFDDGRVQQTSHVHRDVPRALAEPDPMSKHLPAALLGPSRRLQQASRLNFLENGQKFLDGD